MVSIPAGPFLVGSMPAEREYGYHLDETLHGSSTARQHRWFENETRRQVTLPTYHIDRTPVTNAAYHRFIASTGHRGAGGHGKGGSWDDLPDVTRAAARHGRPADLKHILIGFCCVSGPPTAD